MLHGSGARLCMVAEPVSARFPDSNLTSVMLRVVGVFSAQLNEKAWELKVDAQRHEASSSQRRSYRQKWHVLQAIYAFKVDV